MPSIAFSDVTASKGFSDPTSNKAEKAQKYAPFIEQSLRIKLVIDLAYDEILDRFTDGMQDKMRKALDESFINRRKVKFPIDKAEFFAHRNDLINIVGVELGLLPPTKIRRDN